VKNCHLRESVASVPEIIDAFCKGEQGETNFWLKLHGKFIYIYYIAVRDENGVFKVGARDDARYHAHPQPRGQTHASDVGRSKEKIRGVIVAAFKFDKFGCIESPHLILRLQVFDLPN